MFKKLIRDAIQPMLNTMLETILEAINNIEINTPTIEEPVITEPTVNEPTVTNPEITGTFKEKLGVNITWASDKQVDNPKGPEMFNHVRWFQMARPGKDYGNNGTPATVIPAHADMDNLWSSDTPGIRDNMVRIVELLKNYSGYVILSPEDPEGRKWPSKFWTTEELGSNPEQAGYDLANAYFTAYEQLSKEEQARIIQAWDNEEWDGDPKRVAAYNQWRSGWIRRHREHVSKGGLVKLSCGARQFTNRIYNGKTLSESIKDIPKNYLQYLHETNGYVNFHLHDRIEDFGNESVKSKGVIEFFNMVNWCKEQGYTNIKFYIGEYSFITNNGQKILASEILELDFKTIKAQIEFLIPYVEFICWYQIDDHSWPEGKFDGSSALMRYNLFKAFGSTKY